MVKEKPLLNTQSIKINFIELEPDEDIPYHMHKDTKYNYILKGSMSDGVKAYLPGNIIENIKDSGHSLKSGEEGCEFLVIWCEK